MKRSLRGFAAAGSLLLAMFAAELAFAQKQGGILKMYDPDSPASMSIKFQYSGGVAAEPGFRIERARFARSLPLADGFDAIEAYLARIGRSPTAFCACELRSPAQFTDAGFVAFNRHYVERLAAWGIFREEVNPVARSNVCPEIDPPATPSFYAFSYTVPSESRAAQLCRCRKRRSARGRPQL